LTFSKLKDSMTLCCCCCQEAQRSSRSRTAFLLVHVENAFAPGAGVVGVFEVLHEEGDQTATEHKPAQNEDKAHDPSVRSDFVRDLSEHLLLTACAGRHPRVVA